MRRRSADLLVDPADGGTLDLVVWESSIDPLTDEQRATADELGIAPESLEENVRSGVLLNRATSVAYPIYRGVPRMLTFPIAVADRFRDEFRAQLEALGPDVHLPNGTGAIGEVDVLRSFSTEWTDYGWAEDAYWNMPAHEWLKCMDVILNLHRKPAKGELLLEVGIGIGGVADHVARTQRCEIVGVDLGYSVDAAYETFGSNPFLHIVQASAFAPPFRDGTFDYTYSFGVIHHTYSTEFAFFSIARLVKPGGRLYVWVYSPDDESRTRVRKALMATERVVRPVVWRLPEKLQTLALLPFVPAYIAYQKRRASTGDHDYSTYGWREALHAARDRFTPRFVHRHTEEEVKTWFRRAGFEQLWSTSSDADGRELPEPLWRCTGVHGLRRVD